MPFKWIFRFFNCEFYDYIIFLLPQTLESYATTLKECIDASKYQVVILIDSLDDALELDELSWLPTKLNDKIKVIITTATTSAKVDHIDKCEKTDVILWHLKDRISKSNFAHLNQFSDQKWNEVLSHGGGDFFSVNPQLQLPDSWKQCDEKIPLQAKVSRKSVQIQKLQKHYYFNNNFSFFFVAALVVCMAWRVQFKRHIININVKQIVPNIGNEIRRSNNQILSIAIDCLT